MKFSKTLSLLVIASGAAALVAAQGCSSDKTEAPSTSASGRVPPSPPSGAAPSDTPARTFAINQISIGDATRDGSPSKEAWQDYGYNLDGLVTEKESTNVCTRFEGAVPVNQEDGKDGVDNSFGRIILPAIRALVPNPSNTLNDALAAGDFTVLFSVKGLTDDAKQTSTGLSGQLLVGGKFDPSKRPAFAPTEDWPHRKDPIIPLEGAYINNGTFVYGGGGATVVLSLVIQGTALTLTVNRASITFDHRPPNDVVNGNISGVIDTETFVSGIENVAGALTTKLCDGAALERIKKTIREASDIRADGTNGPGVPCDAISVGIGFTGKRVGESKSIAVEGPKAPDPCAVGADGGT